jgi:hypothetical protein
MTYQIKDLGYKRTQSEAKMRATFSTGEAWEFPVQVVADSRDEHYADEKEDTIGEIRRGRLDNGDLTEWAINNMNWDELAPYAQKVAEPRSIDPADEWMSADREVVGKV